MEYEDDIYGKVTIPKDIWSIISTDQFQRLKEIKQLGLLYIVIPGATHTRYKHCIGTYLQAREMLNAIEQNTKRNLEIPPQYRKAVEVAALLHDIGHGPFSHVWEHVNSNYKHEEIACNCVDSIFQSVSAFNELREENNYGIEMVKALILGDPLKLFPIRPLEDKYGFLFEIVNNHQCKLDVDKWDYLKRDNFHLSAFLKRQNINPNMDFDDVFLKARVSDDGAHIEYRYQDYEKICALFQTRFDFHFHCYRNPYNVLVETLFADQLKKKAELFEINSSCMVKFLKFTDQSVLDSIENWTPDINKYEKIDDQGTVGSINIPITIPFPEAEMPDDENFHFYGDRGALNPVRRPGHNERVVRFRVRSI